MRCHSSHEMERWTACFEKPSTSESGVDRNDGSFHMMRFKIFDEMPMLSGKEQMNCSLLIVASVSKWTNMAILSNNIDMFDSSWKCLIFGHETPRLADVPERCSSVVLHGTMWAEVMHRGADIINSYNCDNHIVMLDDIKIDSGHLSVHALEQYADKHNLEIASPRVKGSTHPWMNDCTRGMAFIEIFFTLFKKRAWKSFQRLIKFVPGVGWGYDICLAEHYRSGIDCHQEVTHLGHRSLTKINKRAEQELKKITQNCSNNVRL